MTEPSAESVARILAEKDAALAKARPILAICVYCGLKSEYPTPETVVDGIREHVAACDARPERALEADLAAMRMALPEPSVRRFHDAFGIHIGGSWEKPERRALRRRLITEEYNEYIEAEAADDGVATLDALVDIVYVVVGAAVEYGMDFSGAFTAVHAANMAKLGPDKKPIVRPDGKILKPDGWRPADLTPFLAGDAAAPAVSPDAAWAGDGAGGGGGARRSRPGN